MTGIKTQKAFKGRTEFQMKVILLIIKMHVGK